MSTTLVDNRGTKLRGTALTECQVAEQLGLSVATLRAWRHRGRGPRFVRFGRAIRYLSGDIEQFIRDSAIDTRPVSTSDRKPESAAGQV